MNESSRPSKQFIIRGGIALGIVVIVLVVQTNWFHNLFRSKKPATSTQKTYTVADLTTKDSNGNGIPDWEETLWGLDPTVLYTNGKSNAEIIKEKKLALGITDSTTGTPTNQTDAIAQQLFSITTALSQNGDVSDNDLQSIADKLGASVNVDTIGNTYSLKNIHTISTSTASLRSYYKNITAILGKHDLNEADITIIINAAETGDYSELPQLSQTGADYKTIASQLSAISVPIGVAQYHLDIINSLAGMAASFGYIQKMQDDGTQALVGVAMYKVYSSRGQKAFYDLQDYLTKYGILSS